MKEGRERMGNESERERTRQRVEGGSGGGVREEDRELWEEREREGMREKERGQESELREPEGGDREIERGEIES